MNWIREPLSDICDTTSGGTPSRKVQEYYQNGTIPWVKSGELENNIILDTEEYITEEALANSSAKIFPAGTLLIALYGATIGKLAFLGIPAATNQAVCAIFENKKVSLKYLYYYLLFKRSDLVKQGIGGAQPNISQAILKKLIIPYPVSISDQERIVARIEELFSQLYAGVETLKKTKAQLAVYRQAVLKEAFSSELSSKTVEINEIVDDIRIGPFGTMLHKSDYITGGVPVINPQHIKNGKILPGASVTVSEEKARDLSAYRLQTNDIIMGRRGEMGRAAAITDVENGWLCGTGSILFRLKSNFDAGFYAQILSSPDVVHYLEEHATGTTMKNLNEEIVQYIPVPFVTTEMQWDITMKMDSKMSVCDSIEQTVDAALQQAEAMRQSILKDAFEGRL